MNKRDEVSFEAEIAYRENLLTGAPGRIAMTRRALLDAGFPERLEGQLAAQYPQLKLFLKSCQLFDQGYELGESQEPGHSLGTLLADMSRQAALFEAAEVLFDEPEPFESAVACGCHQGCAFCQGAPLGPGHRRVARACVIEWASRGPGGMRQFPLPAWVEALIAPAVMFDELLPR